MSKSRRSRKKVSPISIVGAVLTLVIGVAIWVLQPMLRTGELSFFSGTQETDDQITMWGRPKSQDASKTTTTSHTVEIKHVEIPTLIKSRPEQVIEHVGYTVSYNPEWRVPNWVAYELTADEVDGVEERANHFKPDPLVKGDPVVTKDYSNSGYDRGHMAPAADMKWSEEAMRESFYMTNMCPQLHNLNAGDWKVLEEKVRDWAQQYSHIYVACGPIVGKKYETIGTERKIAVPGAFYKVVLCEDNGQWQAIGFIMSNIAGHKKLSAYVRSVDDVEISTGIDFFSALPDSIEERVESTYDLPYWGIKL